MSMVMGVKTDQYAFQALFRILVKLERPTASALLNIERSVREGFRDNFAGQMRGDNVPWASLAPRTQRERAARGYGATAPILVRSGAYRASWVDAPGWRQVVSNTGRGGWTMSVSSSHPYVETHELGDAGRNVPARPVRYLGTPSERRIAAAIDLWVADVIAKTI